MASSRHTSRSTQNLGTALRDVQQRLDGNLHCADCSFPRPEYINLTIGTFICDKCAEVHRSTSNRRIKDMYGDDITEQDVRRMETVGNDVANRKFLAIWDPKEFPEPNRRDKEAMREFLWLKYDGTFKRPSQPRQQNNQQHSSSSRRPSSSVDAVRDYARDPRDRHNNDDHGRPYRRENELFQNNAAPPPSDRPSSSYWSSRFAPPSPHPPAPMPRPNRLVPPPPRNDEYYRRDIPPGVPVYSNQYHTMVPPNRFQPPQHLPVAMYGPGRGGHPAYDDRYEDYGPQASYDRDLRRRPPPPSRGDWRSRAPVYEYSDDEDSRRDDEPVKRKSKTRGGSRRKSSATEDDLYPSDEVDDDADSSERRSKKATVKKSSKKAKKSKAKESSSRRRAEKERSGKKKEDEDDEDEQYEDEDEFNDSEDDDEEEERVEKRQKSKRKGASSDKRSGDGDSIRTASADGLDADVVDTSNPAAAVGGKKDFDLMSEWMGDSKNTDTSQSGAIPPTGGVPTSGPPLNGGVQNPLHQAYQTQMPMMSPLNMYSSVMPGFMPMMPPGMSPFMPGLMAPPSMHPGMVPMPGGVQPHQGGGVPPMHGLMSGMQNLGIHSQPQGSVPMHTQPNLPNVSSTSAPTPPPPPPLGMPAGPPPGPPPEPPQ